MKDIYVIADIHGELKKLKHIISKILIIDQNPKLVFLGDYVDRGPHSAQVIDFLLDLSKSIEYVFLVGNHDYEFFKLGLDQGIQNIKNHGFYNAGVEETLMSYNYDTSHMKRHYTNFYLELQSYHIENNNLFVHGGFNRHHHIKDHVHNNLFVLIWDRDLIMSAKSYEAMCRAEGFDSNKYKFRIHDGYDNVFIGHTPVQYFQQKHIMVLPKARIHLCDTGLGKYDNAIPQALRVHDLKIIE